MAWLEQMGNWGWTTWGLGDQAKVFALGPAGDSKQGKAGTR